MIMTTASVRADDLAPEDQGCRQPTLCLCRDPLDGVEPSCGAGVLFNYLPNDYRFLEYLGRSPFAEVGKVQAPNGQVQLVHLIASFGKLHLWARNDLAFVERLKAARHPALAGVEWARKVRGTILLFTEGADETLWERHEQCRSEGMTGIPREELIDYLRTAAEALDYLGKEHALCHLGLNPWSLWLRQGQLVVADFGLMQYLLLPAGKPLSETLARYADPEPRTGSDRRACDQYSLACIYLEMLTGDLSQPIDLDRLPMEDRKTLARALHADPEERFPSCSAFVAALAQSSSVDCTGARLWTPSAEHLDADEAFAAASTEEGETGARGQGALDDSRELELPPLATGHESRPAPDQWIADLVHQAMDDARIEEKSGIRYAFLGDGSVQHKCAAWLTAEVARQKLTGFFQHWQPDTIQADADAYFMRVPLKPTVWQWLTFRQPAFEVTIQLGGPQAPLAKMTEITVRLAYRGGKPSDGRPLLEKFCPPLLQSLHQYLLSPPEQRARARFPFAHPLAVAPRYASGRDGKAVRGLGKDLSATGIGFHLPQKPATDAISISWNIQLTSREIVSISVPARVRYVHATDDGQVFVGAQFILEEKPGQTPENGLTAEQEQRRQKLKNQRDQLLAALEKNRRLEHHLAYHDALTGLPNRRLFEERLQEAIVQATPAGRRVAVLFIDLDGFKNINDTFGHKFGDCLLQAVAQRLQSCVRGSDTVARLGGDEFTIVLREIDRDKDADRVARQLIELLSRPVVVNNQQLRVTASIGISLYPSDGTDLDTLVGHADRAMYHAKKQGKNRYCLGAMLTG